MRVANPSEPTVENGIVSSQAALLNAH